MFKPGDKAWHPQYGWGTITGQTISEYPIEVWIPGTVTDQFVCACHEDGRINESDLNPVIFHKEQKFDLSEPEPEIGTWGYFWDFESSKVVIFTKLVEIRNTENKYVTMTMTCYKHFSPSLPQHIKDMMEGKG